MKRAFPPRSTARPGSDCEAGADAATAVSSANMEPSIPAKEQFSGCLVAQCMGDALGLPVEGNGPAVCEEYARTLLRAAESRLAMLPSSFGQYTDDSQLARELLQSYVGLGRFEAGDYAARIAAIFREGRIVGRGRATSEAAERLIRGTLWTEAGTPPPSAGNGSAMRAAPIGLMFWDDPERMLAAAHDQGRITHQDPRCSAGAVAVAGAVALALRGTIDREGWVRQLGRWVDGFDPVLGHGIRQLADLARASPRQALPVIRSFGCAADYDNGWLGISPFVTQSVLWSLYSFLRQPEDYWGTIRCAIAVGGDVDTTAAMAGAISGAYLGLDALPMDLADRLTDRGTWELAQLVQLAHRCHAIKHDESSLDASVG